MVYILVCECNSTCSQYIEICDTMHTLYININPTEGQELPDLHKTCLPQTTNIKRASKPFVQWQCKEILTVYLCLLPRPDEASERTEA